MLLTKSLIPKWMNEGDDKVPLHSQTMQT